MKKIVFLLLALGLFSCEKDEDPFSIDPSTLPGTYWTETERYYEPYGDVNALDPEHIRDGAPGVSVLLFGNHGKIVEYLSVQPSKEPWIDNFYRNTTYVYDNETKLLASDLHALHTVAAVVTGWTSDRLEIVCFDRQGEPYGRQVFKRFDPDEEWLRTVAAWPNYDQIDWGY